MKLIKLNGGIVMNTLIYKELPDNVFIPIIRKRDIVTARPLSREEKREYGSGGPDILLTSPTGEQRLITRQELVANYTYINGKKISISGWSSKRRYLIGKMDDTQLFGMLVPTNCTLKLKGKTANKANKTYGDYIICLPSPNGGIDRESAGLIPNKIFRKMFHIPENEVITRNIGKGNAEFNPDRARKRRNKSRAEIKRSTTPDFGLNEDAFANMAAEIQKQPSKTVDTSGLNNKVKVRDEKHGDNKKFIAIGRLMRNGNLEGFVIQNTRGATRNITKQEMMQLCQRKLVTNVMLSRKEETGKYFLRGNGIRIDMLEQYDI